MSPGLAEGLGFSQIPLVVTPLELDPLRRMVRGGGNGGTAMRCWRFPCRG